MTDLAYVGQELTIFAHATNWKEYYTSLIRPYFGRKVLEVGAGLGATTAVMCDGSQDEWVCLEPDAAMRTEIDALIAAGRLPACCRTQEGSVGTLPAGALFDTLVYIDVLEHIEDDRAELAAAAAHLAPGGALVVLSPAHNFLFSPFDKSIGHWRRYNKRMLREITPPGLRIEKLIYLDSVGTLTSLANSLLLNQPMPKVEQILFWDRYLLPLSRLLDPLTAYLTGRSIVGVWRTRLPHERSHAGGRQGAPALTNRRVCGICACNYRAGGSSRRLPTPCPSARPRPLASTAAWASRSARTAAARRPPSP